MPYLPLTNKQKELAQMATTSIPQKQCFKCHEIKPLYEFHKQHIARDGYRSTCKLCRSLQSGGAYVPGAPDGYHICRTCNQCLPHTIEYFHRNGNAKNGLTCRCRKCAISVSHEWYGNNPDKGKRTRSIYASVHSQEAVKRAREWRLDNPVRHKVLLKVAKSRRRAREKGLFAYMNGGEWAYALEYFGHQCAVCGYSFDDKRVAAADHWKSLYRGGVTIAHNIIPLCHATKGNTGGCNNSKSVKDPVKWLNEKYSKSEVENILGRISAYFDCLKQGT